ncbi:MAG: GDP-mannose 4,6-dehydratase [bacterium]
MTPRPITDAEGSVYGQTRYAAISGFGPHGQDANHLAAYLLPLGYRILALAYSPLGENSDHLLRLPELRPYYNTGCLKLVDCDVRSPSGVRQALRNHDGAWLDEFYHLAALSQAGEPLGSEEDLLASDAYQVNAGGTLNVLEAIAAHAPQARVLLAGTSQMFGHAAFDECPQTEKTPMRRCLTVYGETKRRAYEAVIKYGTRQVSPVWGCTAILYYHKSWLSSEKFMWAKAINGLIYIHSGERSSPVELGNLNAEIDFGWPPDYARAMHLILNQRASAPSEMRDYIVATGETHSVREFVVEACRAIWGEDVQVSWEGTGSDEQLLVNHTPVVTVSPDNLRPYREPVFCGDATQLRALGWESTHTLKQMVEESVRQALAQW